MNLFRAEIIAIGDELTSGQRLDTNSQWLAQRLGEMGVRTVFHTTVGDDLTTLVEAFRVALDRVDLVVATGGLGPTADDLTRDAIATATASPLELREDVLAHIEALFAKRYRTMPERNRVQAMFPRGSRIIPNPHGSAPGIDLTWTKSLRSLCRVFALPGVPAEMCEMWEQTVVHRLRNEVGLGSTRAYFRQFKLFGLGESDVEVKLPHLIARDRDPLVGITVSRATITLRISTMADSEASAADRMAPVVREIEEHLGEFVFAEGDEELEDVVLRLLRQRSETASIIEIGECDLAGQWIREKPQSDHTTDRCKCRRFLTVDSLLAHYDSHSQESTVDWTTLADQVASKALQQDGSHWVVIAGPYPDHAWLSKQNESQERSFEVAVCGRGKALMRRSARPFGHPDVVLHRMAKLALDTLRRRLIAD